VTIWYKFITFAIYKLKGGYKLEFSNRGFLKPKSVEYTGSPL